MKYDKLIEQVLTGSILLLLGKAVMLIGGIYSTVVRLESKLDETYARTGRIGEKVGENSRALVDHEHRITVIEHTN